MKRAQIKFCELPCIFLSSIWATCKQMRDVPTVKESDLLMITQPPRDRPFGSSWRSNTNNSNLKEKKTLLLVLKRDFGTISKKKKHLEGVVKAGIENKRQIINIFIAKMYPNTKLTFPSSSFETGKVCKIPLKLLICKGNHYISETRIQLRIQYWDNNTIILEPEFRDLMERLTMRLFRI